MDAQLRFGLSVVLSFLTWGLVAKYYIWPFVRAQRGRAGFRPILLLHATRFVGLGFLVPGVADPAIPVAFAGPAAYGDLIAALLALATLAVLDTPFGLLLLWAFNLWGTADLLFAYYQGIIGVRVEAGLLGAMYYIPTLVVPLLLVTHGLAFRLLLTRRARD